MQRAGMPETTIDKHGDFGRYENYVGFSWKLVRNAIAKPHRPQTLSELDFRFRVLATNS